MFDFKASCLHIRAWVENTQGSQVQSQVTNLSPIRIVVQYNFLGFKLDKWSSNRKLYITIKSKKKKNR